MAEAEKERGRIVSAPINFKFCMCSVVKTIFGNKGIVQTLAFERGGNKYWVKFSDNKLNDWFWEDELALDEEPSFGFKK